MKDWCGRPVTLKTVAVYNFLSKRKRQPRREIAMFLWSWTVQ